jgi:hypothetical protein
MGRRECGRGDQVHHLTRLLYRHWDEWRENVRHHVFVASVSGGEARDLTPGDFDSPPTQQEDAAIRFTPDGGELVFVSNREGIDRDPPRRHRPDPCGKRSLIAPAAKVIGAAGFEAATPMPTD